MKLSIPNPCRQSWAEMNPAEKGRFCAACEKTVVDFTFRSDKEIIDHLKTANGKVCGRFQMEQLNKELVYSYMQNFRFRRFMAFLFGGISAFGAAYAQQDSARKDNSGYISTLKNAPQTSVLKTPSRIRVRGIVGDKKTGEPLPFVAVTVKGTTTGVNSDFDGMFTLLLDSTDIKDPLTLKFNYIGYEIREVVITRPSAIVDFGNVLLVPAEQVLQGDVIMVVQPEADSSRKNLFQRVFEKKKK
jgi:hypothetical protein